MGQKPRSVKNDPAGYKEFLLTPAKATSEFTFTEIDRESMPEKVLAVKTQDKYKDCKKFGRINYFFDETETFAQTKDAAIGDEEPLSQLADELRSHPTVGISLYIPLQTSFEDRDFKQGKYVMQDIPAKFGPPEHKGVDWFYHLTPGFVSKPLSVSWDAPIDKLQAPYIPHHVRGPWNERKNAYEFSTGYWPSARETHYNDDIAAFGSLQSYLHPWMGGMLLQAIREQKDMDIAFGGKTLYEIEIERVASHIIINVILAGRMSATDDPEISNPVRAYQGTVVTVKITRPTQITIVGEVLPLARCPNHVDFQILYKCDEHEATKLLELLGHQKGQLKAVLKSNIKLSDIKAKLAAGTRLARHFEDPANEAPVFGYQDGETRQAYSERALIFDNFDTLHGVNLIQHAMGQYDNLLCEIDGRYKPEPRDLSHMQNFREDLEIQGAINAEQREFLDQWFAGVPSSILGLHGFPGSGKTRTVIFGTIESAKLGYKTMAVSARNSAVETFLDNFVRLTAQWAPDLGDRCVWVTTEADEIAQLDMLRSPAAGDKRVKSYHLAARMHNDPNSPLPKTGKIDRGTKEFQDYRNSKIAAPLVLGCTPHIAWALNKEKVRFGAHIIVGDDASNLTDIELMQCTVPTKSVLLVVLAGDTKQLGPVLTSEKESPYTSLLNTSTMLRLQAHHASIKMVTLTYNYRSHGLIQELANEIHYQGKMQVAYANNSDHWDKALNQKMSEFLWKVFRKCPAGEDQRKRGGRQFLINVDSDATKYRGDERSPSFVNIKGCKAIYTLVHNMLKDGVTKEEDIVVITMYRDDLRCLQDLFKHTKVEVRTCDGFQGREKQIVVIHWVAAFKAPSSTFRHVDNYRRHCVALTRAMEYTFMVGNVSNWRKRQQEKGIGNKTQSMSAMRKLMDAFKLKEIDWRNLTLPTPKDMPSGW